MTLMPNTACPMNARNIMMMGSAFLSLQNSLRHGDDHIADDRCHPRLHAVHDHAHDLVIAKGRINQRNQRQDDERRQDCTKNGAQGATDARNAVSDDDGSVDRNRPGDDCAMAIRSIISFSSIHPSPSTKRLRMSGTMTYPPPNVKALSWNVDQKSVQKSFGSFSGICVCIISPFPSGICRDFFI